MILLTILLSLSLTPKEIHDLNEKDLIKLYSELTEPQRLVLQNLMKKQILPKIEPVEDLKDDKIQVIDTEDTLDTEDTPSSTKKDKINKDKLTPDTTLKYIGISMITVFISEIGDKTFFIVAILGMKNPKITIILANMLAMTTMTLISAFLGHLVPNLIHSKIVSIIAGLILILFGCLMLMERKSNKIKQEYDEAKDSLAEDNLDTGESKLHGNHDHILTKFGVSSLFISSFTMIFLAEWGDRSQMSTIVLGASGGLVPVVIGSILGHGLCTAVAIAFGHLVAQRLSARHGSSFLYSLYYWWHSLYLIWSVYHL